MNSYNSTLSVQLGMAGSNAAWMERARSKHVLQQVEVMGEENPDLEEEKEKKKEKDVKYFMY